MLPNMASGWGWAGFQHWTSSCFQPRTIVPCSFSSTPCHCLQTANELLGAEAPTPAPAEPLPAASPEVEAVPAEEPMGELSLWRGWFLLWGHVSLTCSTRAWQLNQA